MMVKQEVSATKRLRQIVNVISKNHFLANFYHQTNPEVIVAALEEVGPHLHQARPTFLSTRPDLVSPSYISALETLQDQVQEDDFDTVKTTIEESTGQTLAELFADFENIPSPRLRSVSATGPTSTTGPKWWSRSNTPPFASWSKSTSPSSPGRSACLSTFPRAAWLTCPGSRTTGPVLRSEIDFTIEAQATQRFTNSITAGEFSWRPKPLSNSHPAGCWLPTCRATRSRGFG